MFTKKDHFEYKPTIPGVRMRPLVYENRTIMCEFLLEHGHELPIHSHPYEQSGYLVSGRLRFHIGEEWMDTMPGDSWCIPENVMHEVIVLEDSHLIELFSPVRPDYLPGNYGKLS
jgi:quercetin dioxygenase-like cupin family protein